MWYTENVILMLEGQMREDIGGFCAKRVISKLNTRCVRVEIFDTVDSTNTQARREAEAGMSAPALIIADSQSGGRGRMGRSFYSPESTGLYMSLLLRARENSADTVRLTTAAAVAVALCIEELCGISTDIKWVNDLYLSGRKICGILCESFTTQIGERFAIAGIGVNLSTSDFPEELRGKAASLGQSEDIRAELAAAITDKLLGFWEDISAPEIMEYYRAHSAVLGRRIIFTEGGVEYFGVAESIDGYGRLSVALEGGARRLLSCGEISLRLDCGE